jgi:hypothetical protein
MGNDYKGLVAVEMARSEDWVTNTYRLRIVRQWLAERGVEALEMGGMPDEFPHTILVPKEDAVAFKLKFGARLR